jgi:hypothetical protein
MSECIIIIIERSPWQSPWKSTGTGRNIFILSLLAFFTMDFDFCYVLLCGYVDRCEVVRCSRNISKTLTQSYFIRDLMRGM